MEGCTATTRHGVTRKRSTTRLQHISSERTYLSFKGNHSKGREFQDLAVRGKKLLT